MKRILAVVVVMIVGAAALAWAAQEEEYVILRKADFIKLMQVVKGCLEKRI